MPTVVARFYSPCWKASLYEDLRCESNGLLMLRAAVILIFDCCCKKLKCFEFRDLRDFKMRHKAILQGTQNFRLQKLVPLSTSKREFALNEFTVHRKRLLPATYFRNNMQITVRMSKESWLTIGCSPTVKKQEDWNVFLTMLVRIDLQFFGTLIISMSISVIGC